MMLLVGFGWAKPVPVNTRHFRKPRRDFALTSFAGPMMNFIVALVSAFIYMLVYHIALYNGIFNMTIQAILLVFEYSLILNVGLGLFNLIPLPPLDGSNIVMCLLPNNLAAKYSKLRYYSRYIFLGLILLQYVPVLNFVPDLIFAPLSYLRMIITGGFMNLADIVISPIFANM
jgi:Zn-dependent protease